MYYVALILVLTRSGASACVAEMDVLQHLTFIGGTCLRACYGSNHLYGVDMGTSGLVLPAQSPREILADKVVALAMRRNRLKNRDLWDIAWLHQGGSVVDNALVRQKLTDRTIAAETFLAALRDRMTFLANDEAAYGDFRREMERFVPIDLVEKTVRNPQFWAFLTRHVGAIEQSLRRELGDPGTAFEM